MKIKLNEKGINRLLVLLRREVMVNPGKEIRIDWEYLEDVHYQDPYTDNEQPQLGEHPSGMSHSDPLGDEYD